MIGTSSKILSHSVQRLCVYRQGIPERYFRVAVSGSAVRLLSALLAVVALACTAALVLDVVKLTARITLPLSLLDRMCGLFLVYF